jgi:hypothetical protein
VIDVFRLTFSLVMFFSHHFRTTISSTLFLFFFLTHSNRDFMTGLNQPLRGLKGDFSGIGGVGASPYSNFSLAAPGMGIAGTNFLGMGGGSGGRGFRADSFGSALMGFGGGSPRDLVYSQVRTRVTTITC